MDNLRASIELLFSRGDSQSILDHVLGLYKPGSINKFSKERFVCTHQNDFRQRYNDDQVENIYEIIKNKWELLPNNAFRSEGNNRDKGHPINILVHFATAVLAEKDNKPICNYFQLLRWREMTLKLGEDIFTTAFLAYNDIECARTRNFFGWEATIPNDNTSLQAIFKEQKLSELHFHLKGSTQVFDLNWLSLMNHTLNRSKAFKKLQQSQSPDVMFDQNDKILSLHALTIKAAAIRAYLFIKLFNAKAKVAKFDELLRVSDEKFLKFRLEGLQRSINFLRLNYGRKYGNDVVDYAIPKNLPQREVENQLSSTINHGERLLMYTAFRHIFAYESEYQTIRDLLYAYLIAKIRIRKELIQMNEGIGFKNFQNYEKRKECFIEPNSIYSTLVYNMAINSSLTTGNVEYIEARITPRDSLAELTKSIISTDDAIEDRRFLPENSSPDKLSDKPIFDRSYHYILHYIKSSFSEKESDPIWNYIHSRNYNLREQIKQQTFAINELRKSVHSARSRVVGIDAASSEIGHRPEIFATAYRYLKYYSHNPRHQYLIDDKFMKLGFTYHVGEDFLDMADGLRSIDEAILFLNLNSGDRVGHGLVLGIDPCQYYKRRNHHIIMSAHDFLDNIAWILITLPQTNAKPMPTLTSKLEGLFYKYYDQIYGPSQHITPYIYYQAWKLRGDDPKHYLHYKLHSTDSFNPIFTNFWSKAGLNNFQENIGTYRTDQIIELYVNYHYNPQARNNGKQMVEEQVDFDYVKAIKIIQEFMCCKIADRHIMIETNPSSNQVVGEYKHYDQHPLVNLYNVGLTTSIDKLNSSHQIHVSIGTDDQGVFATSQENEYSLMALSLEKCCDTNNVLIYNHTHICDWLRRIAQMSHEHRFLIR